MKELIKHLVNNHLDIIVEKSFLNCHVMGLHSIMLLESPEQTIRLFVSDGNSKLKKNTEENILKGKQTLAFHPHHCNITLHVVKGNLTNHIVRQVPIEDPIYNSRDLGAKGCFFANKYIYESAIRASENSVPKFKFSSQQLLQLVDTQNIYTGQSLFLNASDIHTVTTYGQLTTAWFVY